jgi:hypothetical protein
MWAGATSEFFKRTQMAANSEIVSKETYSPTVGLTNVTQANPDYLSNFYVDDAGEANLQVFSVQPENQVRAVISADGQPINETTIMFDPAKAVTLNVNVPDGAKVLSFMLVDEGNNNLLTGELMLH